MKAIILSLALLQVAWTNPARVSIRIQSSSIVCSVHRNVDNRWLNMGIEGHVGHRVQLDGEASPVTHQFSIPNGICDEEEQQLTAYCDLFWAPEGHDRVKADFLCRH